MSKLLKNHSFLLILFTAISSLSLWLIFYFNLPAKIGFPETGLEAIYANYDGPNYLIIAKCGYSKECIGPNYSLPQPLEYYPAHFPGYPLLIKFFDFFTTGPKAMLLTTLLGSIFLSLAAYNFFRLFLNSSKSFTLSLLLLFVPPRLFILRSVGAPEGWFLASILTSIIFFKKQRFWLSAIFAALAQLIKTPGVLLTFSYLLLALHQLFFQKEKFFSVVKKYSPFLLTPLVVLAVFYLYKVQVGDFWAYFHSGDNFHLNFLPFTVFISNQTWVDSIWLEEIIYIYFLAIYALYRLSKKISLTSPTFLFPLIFLIASLLVSHRDISRYISPVYPFMLLAYSSKLTSKPIIWILVFLIPAIFLYSINFILGNTAPIADWASFL